MGWTNELYKVYELAIQTRAGESILPISHKTEKAQIEITINEDGDFVSANSVNEEDSLTIIPDTGKAKTGKYGGAPYPLNESLKYVAGDLKDYISKDIKKDKENVEKTKENYDEFIKTLEKNHSDYIKLLGKWVDSQYTHKGIQAIYNYVLKSSITYDCIQSGILKIDPNTHKVLPKQNGENTEKCFVRFIIHYKDLKHETRTWKDTSLYESFISFNNDSDNKQLCYATGKMLPAIYIHPMGIVKNNARAKLISADDKTNYTYRGRFSNKEEAISVSYDYSQKMHNALKWLIERERKTKTDKNGKEIAYNPMVFDSLTLVVWNSALDFVPDITESILGDIEEEEYSSKPVFAEMLHKKLMGGKSEFDPDSKVMVMGLDSATTGRLSISMYTELAESRFVENLEYWHSSTAWARKRYIKNKYESITDSCSLPQITSCLYGTEQGAFLECDKKVLRDTILRLLPCVTERRKLPRDIVQTLYNRASNPLAFSNEHNHRMIVENTCALIRKEYSDYEKGEIKMAFDPNCTDRSYLFGCLLAIADKAERDTYEKDEKRITNARRFWNAFSSRPYQTWQIIEERLEPYLEKETWVMTKYTKHFNEIMSKMSPEDFADNSKLSPMYLIGFHHYNALLWNGSEDKNEEE